MTARTAEAAAVVARATSAVASAPIRAALDALLATASPPGAERALAESLAAWGRSTYAHISWDVDAIDDRSASLFGRSADGRARELALYGHLDTSLTGNASRDAPITGVATAPPPLRFDERTGALAGFGVGVAKAPSAAALVAFAAAASALRAAAVPHRLTLLLAAGGTHRAAPDDGARFARGVTHALDRGWRPDAVLNTKAGPPGVLSEEPAAAYLRVRVRRRWDAALARATVAPDGGLARHAGAVADAIEEWRAAYLGSLRASGQLAAEIAIGAIRSGSPDKPDLLPGVLELFVYAVLLPGEDPARVARDLAEHVAPRVATLPGAPTTEVDVYASAPGGSADPDSDIVRLVSAAWTAQFGETAPVRRWSGATDGAVFLSRGIPTARAGVRVTRDPADPRVESVPLEDLVRASRAYAEVAVRFFTERPS